MKSKYYIGIDEVGRGPLAGPVGVGVIITPADFAWHQLPGVTDSKQLREAKREAIFQAAQKLKVSGQLDYAVSMVSAKVIDRMGIVSAINLAMKRALIRIETAHQRRQNRTGNCTVLATCCSVKLDGGLIAPPRFVEQETIIKGDSTEKVIGLASIVAKVTRDRYMTRIAKLSAYQAYDFAQHKGYGTKAHRAAIARYGLSPEHRMSYCGNIKIS